MTKHNDFRRGFTAIELLIVIAIISLMGALAAAAVFRLRASQEKDVTETTLTKLHSALDVHWKAVIEAARKDYDGLPNNIKQNLLTLADNVPPGTPALPYPQPRRDDRARLLYVKFRLKQEFPTSPTIARDPAPNYLPPVSVPSSGTFTGRPAYIKAFSALAGVNPKLQSSALLVLALEQSRNGVAGVALDQIVGSNFIRTENGLRYIVDTWGEPLQFFVFPAYLPGLGPSTTDLDVEVQLLPNEQLMDAVKRIVPDKQDPEGLLMHDSISRWRSQNLVNLLHRQLTADPVPSQPQRVRFRRLLPIIASSGADQQLGGGWASVNPWMALPASESIDNLYSFRLRQTGAKGE